MNFTNEELNKLPKWASEKIQSMQRTIDVLEDNYRSQTENLNQFLGVKESNIILSDYTSTTPLPDSQYHYIEYDILDAGKIQITQIKENEGNIKGISIRTYQKNSDFITVVSPIASNVVNFGFINTDKG